MPAARLITSCRATARRSIAAIGSRVDSLVPACRVILTRGLTVFIFHDITASCSAFQRAGQTATKPDVFKQQLSWISARFDILPPSRLRQLGGSGALPSSAAMITFDDAWAGVFQVGLPILAERDIPALCFINMGTVEGDPDLAAVRRYERADPTREAAYLPGPLDIDRGARALAQIRERYGTDADFLTYQGPTATADELAKAADVGNVWFGSHLYHHWDVRLIGPDLYESSFERNAAALSAYPNSMPAFATPHGYAGDMGGDPFAVPIKCGCRVAFTGAGAQNRAPDRPVLDRISLPPQPSGTRDWWFATHRRRILGSR